MNGTNHTNTTDPDPCPLFPKEIWKCNVIYSFKMFSSFVSIMGCFFMLFIIVLFKRIGKSSQNLILNLTIAAFFNSWIYLLNDSDYESLLCSVFGLLLTYSDWVLVFAICSITFNLLLNTRPNSTETHKVWILSFVLCAWILPIVPAFLPLIQTKAYGNAGAWCWLISNTWRYAIWFIPWVIVLLVLLVTYAIIIRRVFKMKANAEGIVPLDEANATRQELFRKEIMSLIFYPFIFLGCQIFAFINRTQNAVASWPDDKNQNVFGLYILMALFSPLSGAISAFVFGFDSTVQEKLNRANIKSAFHNWATANVLEHYTVTDFSGDDGVTVPSDPPDPTSIGSLHPDA